MCFVLFGLFFFLFFFKHKKVVKQKDLPNSWAAVSLGQSLSLCARVYICWSQPQTQQEILGQELGCSLNRTSMKDIIEFQTTTVILCLVCPSKEKLKKFAQLFCAS